MHNMYFEVVYGDLRFAFQEVAGLNEPRANLTFGKGLLHAEGVSMESLKAISMNTVVSGTMTVRLMDGSGTEVTAWRLSDAIPTHLEIQDFGASDIVIASMEVAFSSRTTVRP